MSRRFSKTGEPSRSADRSSDSPCPAPCLAIWLGGGMPRCRPARCRSPPFSRRGARAHARAYSAEARAVHSPLGRAPRDWPRWREGPPSALPPPRNRPGQSAPLLRCLLGQPVSRHRRSYSVLASTGPATLPAVQRDGSTGSAVGGSASSVGAATSSASPAPVTAIYSAGMAGQGTGTAAFAGTSGIGTGASIQAQTPSILQDCRRSGRGILGGSGHDTHLATACRRRTPRAGSIRAPMTYRFLFWPG